MAARLAVVREATGVAAYRNGEYAEALSELRARYSMEEVARYRVMDEPEHRELVLYRLLARR